MVCGGREALIGQETGNRDALVSGQGINARHGTHPEILNHK